MTYKLSEFSQENTPFMQMLCINILYFNNFLPDIKANSFHVYSEKIQNKQKDPVPKIEFCSMTQRDFSVQIFVPEATQLTVNTVSSVMYALIIIFCGLKRKHLCWNILYFIVAVMLSYILEDCT